MWQPQAAMLPPRFACSAKFADAKQASCGSPASAALRGRRLPSPYARARRSPAAPPYPRLCLSPIASQRMERGVLCSRYLYRSDGPPPTLTRALASRPSRTASRSALRAIRAPPDCIGHSKLFKATDIVMIFTPRGNHQTVGISLNWAAPVPVIRLFLIP